MPSLTLKGLPAPLLERLRAQARQQRRSINQQAIYLLEQALSAPRPTLREAHETFVQQHGPPPFGEEFFEGLRDPTPGRPVPFSEEADGV